MMHDKDGSGQYALVDPEEYDLDDEPGSPRNPPSPPHHRSWISIAKIVLLVEAANLTVLAIIFAAWWYGAFPSSTQDYLPSAFNMSRTFDVDKSELRLVANTTDAEEFWMSITRGKNNGLVSLPKEWADAQGLEQSGLATNPGETVFQVDAFHQLHCLVSFRQAFASRLLLTSCSNASGTISSVLHSFFSSILTLHWTIRTLHIRCTVSTIYVRRSCARQIQLW